MDKQSDLRLSFYQIVNAWREFTVVTKLIEKFKSLYGFRGRCLKIRKHSLKKLVRAWRNIGKYVTIHPNRTVSLSEFSFFKIRDVCMDFKPYFKVHNLISVRPESPILCQMTNLYMIFHVLVSVYRLVKIWNSPQFPAEFRNGQYWAVIHITAVTLFMKRGNPCIFPVIRERHLANRLIENITYRHRNKVSTFHDKPSSCQGPLPFTCLVYLEVKILYLDWWIGA